MKYVTPNGGDYSAHPWKIDVAVYIYEDTPITDAEIDAYEAAIVKTLRGEYCVDGCGERGISFWADDADEAALDAILDELAAHDCVIDYPDWYESCTNATGELGCAVEQLESVASDIDYKLADEDVE